MQFVAVAVAAIDDDASIYLGLVQHGNGLRDRRLVVVGALAAAPQDQMAVIVT